LDLERLIQEGLNVPDPKQTWDGAWPPKESDGEIILTLNFNGRNEFAPTVSSTGGLTCGGWCVEMDLTNNKADVDNVWGGDVLKQEGNKFVVCAGWGKGYLDGKGTKQDFFFRVKNHSEMIQPTEAFVYCNGYNRGDKYLVKVNGGGSQPYGWTKGICKPAHICDANGNYIKDSGVINKSSSGGSTPKTTTTTKSQKTTTTTKSQQQTSINDACFATKLGYSCCSGCEVSYTDEDGVWGYESDWCGIKDSCFAPKETCFAEQLGYACCSGCDVSYTDEDGDWGYEDDWCGIKPTCNKGQKEEKKCFSLPDYPCCSAGASVVYTDETGSWGVENGDWCGIN